jgi:CHAD domain-containing protein
MVEVERRFEVAPRFSLPDLARCVPTGGRLVSEPAATLRSTFLDTADLRLARAGATLCHRGDDDALPWSLTLPRTSVAGEGLEIARAAVPTPGRSRRPAATIPADLVALVTVYARGVTLAPAVTIRTGRTRYELRDRDDVLLAEVVDDLVAVLDDRRVLDRFREIAVIDRAGRPKVIRRLGTALTTAGAVEHDGTPRQIRAMASVPRLAGLVTTPADLRPAPSTLGRKANAADAVTAALRTDIGRILHHDPLVRLGRQEGASGSATAAATSGEADPIHGMRVGVRRLRSTLRQFAPLFADDAGDRAAALADELRWLGRVLGQARDAEVIRARLRRVADADPACPLDAASIARIDAELTARDEEAGTALVEALASPRYQALVDRLVGTASAPAFRPVAARRADALLPRFVARGWHRLTYGRHGLDGAADLDATTPDAQWHTARTRVRWVRYAVEVTQPVIGVPAAELAAALTAVSDVLGAHRDAVLAATAWLDIAASDPDDHALAVTAGRLMERERAAARAAADAYPATWRAVVGAHLTAWLP